MDSCKAGDDVTVGGVVVRRWRSFPKDEKPLVDIVFIANNVMQSKEEKVSLKTLDSCKGKMFNVFLKGCSIA